MPSELPAGPPHVALATRGRVQASFLLHELLDDQRRSEERRAASGKEDLLKVLTGRSSLDRAIASTREIISRMDDLLDELSASVSPAGGSESAGCTIVTNGVATETASVAGAVR